MMPQFLGLDLLQYDVRRGNVFEQREERGGKWVVGPGPDRRAESQPRSTGRGRPRPHYITSRKVHPTHIE